MTTSHSQQGENPETPSKNSTALLLLATAIDTTVRTFVPTIGGTLLGIWLDTTFKTIPLFTIVLLVVGFTTAAFLIAQQFRKVRR